MKKAAIAAVVVLLILVVVALMFFRQRPFNYSGVIEAVEINVPTRLNDVITKLHADEGGIITAGQVLAELECKQTDLELDIAEKEFKRAQTLLKSSAGSRENYDLRSNLFEQAALAKSWCKINSPIDGKVLHRFYEEGEFAPAGKKVFTVADLNYVDAWVYVEHDMLSNLKTGQEIKAVLPETGQRFEGVILTINDDAEFTPKNVQTRQERQRLVFGIKTRFKNDSRQSLKPGMTLEVQF
ncbi:ABC transporter related [Elusimicrobium minutum Pei191]|uniref:ABC transporter related n=1 Tax=Elusimicrobium minutum (strain Pei191) TaxID=445932 RepID=B2KDK0_ELUMP|nr:HlyD family efflux transporter periplasmic adaptor subunit [Elusimicrobium minutum]ACC98596.1 ABC transporter related [Elusimicrobium minutum Pei191]